MLITLTYEGPLPSRQQGAARMAKHHLRAHFDAQLRELWLSIVVDAEDRARRTIRLGSRSYSHLVPEPGSGIGVRVDVLMLVPAISKAPGDLDNRVKTLVDALACPSNAEQMIGASHDGEIICLLRDDCQVSALAVERRRWLGVPTEAAQHVKVIVTAHTFAAGVLTYEGLNWIG